MLLPVLTFFAAGTILLLAMVLFFLVCFYYPIFALDLCSYLKAVNSRCANLYLLGSPTCKSISHENQIGVNNWHIKGYTY